MYSRLSAWFSTFASWSAAALGSATAFVLSTAFCIMWALSGPFFGYSDTWQLVINTATTVLTFLAVFLIQNTQNREGKALQLKLDELIRSNEAARNQLIDLEHSSDEEIAKTAERVRPPLKRAAGEFSKWPIADRSVWSLEKDKGFGS